MNARVVGAQTHLEGTKALRKTGGGRWGWGQSTEGRQETRRCRKKASIRGVLQWPYQKEPPAEEGATEGGVEGEKATCPRR